MAKKKWKKYPLMRFRKNDPAHNLLAATQHWVRANGGDLIVVGGIGIIKYLGPHKFKVVIGCMGREPELQKPTNP